MLKMILFCRREINVSVLGKRRQPGPLIAVESAMHIKALLG